MKLKNNKYAIFKGYGIRTLNGRGLNYDDDTMVTINDIVGYGAKVQGTSGYGMDMKPVARNGLKLPIVSDANNLSKDPNVLFETPSGQNNVSLDTGIIEQLKALKLKGKKLGKGLEKPAKPKNAKLTF